MIEHRGLKGLEAVAEHGTVTAAAAALNFTPSAVSQQIGHLASELGVDLLQRDGRRVRLTAAARLLLYRSQEINALWEDTKAQVSASALESVGALRFCGVSSAIAALVAPAMAGLRRTHPRIESSVQEGESADCYRMLAADDADVAVVLPTPGSPPVDDPRFEQWALVDDPQDILLSARHPLADRSGIELSEVAAESWIVKREDNDTYAVLLAACTSAGFAPSVRLEVKEWYAISALVSEGLGICLLPRIIPIPGDHDVVRVPLTGRVDPSRPILVCIRRGSAGHALIRPGLEALTRAAGERQAK